MSEIHGNFWNKMISHESNRVSIASLTDLYITNSVHDAQIVHIFRPLQQHTGI